MKIGQIGEDNFIRKIQERVSTNLRGDIVGIGDDCAVFSGGDKDKFLLVSTDSIVEGCHFHKDKISARDLGYKGVMVNVSDIAAMGGRSLYVLMSIAIPKDTEEAWLDEYMEGVYEACEEAGIVLIGGDTTGSKGTIFINFSIIGEVAKTKVKYRRDAKAGDVVCIGDTIGDSLAGYELMMLGERGGGLVNKHCRPRAQFKEGIWLGEQSCVRAMMDISDGLVQDLGRMMKASNCGAEVRLEKIPLSKEFREFCKERGWDRCEKAIVSGEEYCLLLTVKADEFEGLNKRFEAEFGQQLYAIGIVKVGEGVSYIREDGKVVIESEGYSHFKG